MSGLLPDIPLGIYCILFAPTGLLVFAAAWKGVEVRAVRKWPSTPGVVVVSGEEVRKVKLMQRKPGHRSGSRFVERTFPNIVYEFQVGGQTYSNNRVTIGEDRGDFEVAETIERYPVGRRVTVYYNPDRLPDAVLERELPGMWRILCWTVVVSVVAIFGAIMGFTALTRFASAHVANAPLTIAIGTVATLVALTALGVQWRAGQARRWPVVQAIVQADGLEAFQRANGNTQHRPIYLAARIGYTYQFRGRQHTGLIVALNGRVKPSDSSVQRWANRYQNGKSVKVYVNPAKPAESVLEPKAPGIWVMWVIAFILFALATLIATER